MSDIYDADIVIWSERQANLLRGLAEGHPSNERPDWDNIIEELEDVGRSQIRSVESLLVQALLHDLKVLAWPHSLHVPHWQAEARGFRNDARRAFAPSMKQRIDVAKLFDDAAQRLPGWMDGYPLDKATPIHEIMRAPATLEDALAGP